MSRETETTITLTLPELKDLWFILQACKLDGWYYGHRDYCTKQLGKLLAETNKAIKYLEEQ